MGLYRLDLEMQLQQLGLCAEARKEKKKIQKKKKKKQEQSLRMTALLLSNFI